MVNQILFHLIITVISLALMVKAADLLVYGISNYAKKLGLSDYIIGLLIVSLTASTPELVASFTGAGIGDSGIIFGTILGSNIAGLTFALGSLALYGREMSMKSSMLHKIRFLVLSFLILPIVLSMDGLLSRIDGVILIAVFFLYIFILWAQEGQLGKLKEQIRLRHVYKDAFVFVGALAVIMLSGRYLVFSSTILASMVGISSFFLAITVIAIAATLPDLMVGIKAIKQGHKDVGTGDLLGSVVIKSLLFFGIIALFKPIKVDVINVLVSGLFLFLITAYVVFYLQNRKMLWSHGIFLLLMYFVFVLIISVI